MKTTTCTDCPNTFGQPDNGRRRLCDECRLKRVRKRARDFSHMHPKAERKRKKAEAAKHKDSGLWYEPTYKKKLSISDFNAQARSQGLSYGQLGAKLRS